MSDATVVIDGRFNGPPNSGNGGYVCGLVGGYIDGPAAVRLHAAIPLDRDLALVTANGAATLHDGDTLIAAGRVAEFDLDVPDPPTLEVAEAAAKRYRGFEEHVFSNCFVCGPDRTAESGLRIFAGAVEGRDMVAAPWTPHESLGDSDGHIGPEYLWAALDCPGAFSFPQVEDKACLLGELCTQIDHPVKVGEPCIVIGWFLGNEGRKYYSGTAVFTASGQRCAAARATWIETELPS